MRDAAFIISAVHRAREQYFDDRKVDTHVPVWMWIVDDTYLPNTT